MLTTASSTAGLSLCCGTDGVVAGAAVALAVEGSTSGGVTMRVYMKAIVALCGAVSTWGITAAVDGAFDPVEWFGLLGAVGAALAVASSPANAESDSGVTEP